jgi:hypothetical protein
VTIRPSRPARAVRPFSSQFAEPHADLGPSPSPPVRTPAGTAVALAYEMFGEPGPMTLLRQEGALRILGWTLGSGRAECQQDGRLAELVGVDVILIGDGRYALSERMATEGKDSLSRLEAWCVVLDSPGQVRQHCEEGANDATRAAARRAALDHATRCWPLFRSGASRPGTALPLPFALD